MSEITPALTPDEWREFLDPANADWVEMAYRMKSDLVAAATALYGKPFGFTSDDVAMLTVFASPPDLPPYEPLLLLAARIAALLPPPEVAQSDRNG